MKSLLDVSPGLGAPPPGGGGPEGEGQSGNDIVRSHGVLSLAFGFAAGVALLLIYLIIYLGSLSAAIVNLLPGSSLAFNLLICFVTGFVCGTIISVIYNLLIIRRLNLFGLDRNVD